MIEALTVISAFLGIASMIGGLLGILFTVTVAFSRIRVVEAKIAAPGAYLDMTKILWGDGPWGRWIRAMNVWAFFTYRNLPVIGSKVALRMGTEDKATPRNLKLWALIPVSFTFVCAMIFALSAIFLVIVE
ncbi:hypothetical protein SAMN04487869_10959 [Marinobacter sp. DSM 26671]|jgi:hypothetical protein|nr:MULTISPECIES: hypothetical protein [Marinobacter]MCP4065117.1 hypothetical protein [Gammaproteobacteria bacterium]MEC7728111.1 hypothetical protein [Pseudomonadota bacterium]HCA12037.1 hypothetical protein [Marinobacter adhaerens]AKV95546.1 hypothetical protein ACP86_04840 [Marinobacter sp. CP1]MAK51445.1 hypothetical protein [Marinobacter sp.]|tara:strand:- start:5344 stop:5736 length:393 start_codon:yes stop_codon:yes gene_type:complete